MPNKLIEGIKRSFSTQPHLYVVLALGVTGGLLAAAVQALFRTKGDLTLFAVPSLNAGQYVIFGVFGAIAAGFSVYMAANSRREDLLHLAFFSLSCGIGFPAVLLETQTDAARQAQATIKSAANVVTDSSQSVTKVAPAAAALAAEAVSQAPAREVDKQTRAIVANETQNIIERLSEQNTPAADAAATKVFNAATQAGYSEVVAPAITAPPGVVVPPPPAPQPSTGTNSTGP